MKISLRWLREFVDLPIDDPETLAEVLASLGHEVEGYETLERAFSGVFVGRVEAVEPHPNADRLRLCRVTVGAEPQDIVCGAWNFEAGAIVPVSLPGAVLAGGLEVGVRSLRGVESHGMICSAAELGLGDDRTGILVLDPGLEVGTDFADLVPLPDVVFDLSITPNRPDAMSVLGVARDLAAYHRLSVREPSVEVTETGAESRVTVILEDALGCPRYVGREVRDMRVAPSPLWLQVRLRAAGIRPINNIVDVTNYVLMELGQPLHAFDLDRVAGEQIVVRRARRGEQLTTLDGVARDLSEWDLVIADAERAVAFAGVMGGEDSEVSDTTTRVLIEAAHFDPPTVMFTAKRHDLRTEASARFERGVDPNLPGKAAQRAARLMVDLAGGTCAPGVQDNYPAPIGPWNIALSLTEVPRLLGIDLDRRDVIDLLGRLGFSAEGGDELMVTVPTYRPDVRRPADLVEEIARLYGYDKIPERLPLGTGGGLSEVQRRERRVRALMVGAGFSEASTWSFMSADDVQRLGVPAGDLRARAIAVRNPLRDMEPLLRTTLLTGLLESVRFNVSHGAAGIALFEIGKVFLAEPDPHDPRIPHQPDRLGFVAFGPVGIRRLDGPHDPADVYTATAVWRLLRDDGGLTDTELVPAAEPPFHPGRGATVTIGGRVIGHLGEIHPSVARAFGLEGRVAAGELELEPLIRPAGWWEFREPSTFPPIVFDLAFETEAALPSAALLAAVEAGGGPWLESVRIFDEFTGAPLEAGRKSIAIQLSYRAPDHTLTNEEIAPHRDRVIAAVEENLPARLRGGA